MDCNVVVVLGMYHSGTSALTRGLKALGVELGDKFHFPVSQHNPRGYWENLDIWEINCLLVEKIGLKRALSLSLIPDSQWRAPAVRELQERAVEVLQQNISPNRWWGFKDPKTIRFLPFWIKAFELAGINPRYVVAIRNPISSARSYFKVQGVTQVISYLCWLVHIVPYLKLLRNQPFVVVDYDLLMKSPLLQLNRISSALNISEKIYETKDIEDYAEGFLTDSLRHNCFTWEDLKKDPYVNDLTKTAYMLLYKLACDEIGPYSEQFWEEWSRVEEILNASAPVYRYIDEFEGILASLEARVASLEAYNSQLMNHVFAGSVCSLNNLADSRPIHIWGAGSGGRKTLVRLRECGFQVNAFLDSDKSKWGLVLDGLPVCNPARLVEKGLHGERPYVVIASTYADEILACLASYGYDYRRDYLTQDVHAPVLTLL